MSQRRAPLIFVGVFALSALVSCSTTSQDFKSEGEKFLESPDLAQEAGYTFSNAICQQPTAVSPGTQYSCTATDNDGDDWEFLIEITGERSLTVISGEVLG
ncbi:MAG: hypothetical protein RL119_665 [Actinomycetota bacterium]|jgi:hypothetical protein